MLVFDDPKRWDALTDRIALLIGVPSCDNDLFRPMPDVVATDVDRMATALRQSAYEVRYCGHGDESGQEPTGNRIRAAIMAALRDIPAGGIVLLYFSGHGITINGRGYLVPKDAYAGSNGPDPESLVALMPRNLFECRAKLVLLAVDACRDDMWASEGPLYGTEALPFLDNGVFALFNSCRPGERSLHGDDGSYFTQAFGEVLDRRNAARTLGDAHHEVRRIMLRKAARTDGLEQTPELVVAHRQEDHDHPADSPAGPGGIVICAGDQVGEAWRRAVDDTLLWRRSTHNEEARRQVKDVVLSVVDDCAQRWLDAQEFLEQRDLKDLWAAQDYPARVLSAVNDHLPADASLSLAELAPLIAAPFLREAALSAGVRLAATIEPRNFSRTYQDGPRSELEITHAIHEHVCRRAEGLARRGRYELRDALAMWLVHQWLAGRVALWTDPSVAEFCSRIARAVVGRGTSLTERELCDALPALVQCVDAAVDDQRIVDLVQKKIANQRVRALAALLWLGGILAADPRRVSTVVVDHLGIGTEVQLPALHTAMVNARWERNGNDLALHAICDHPALHAAFTSLTERADLVLHTLDKIDTAPEVLGTLPANATCAGLRPENQGGKPVFETPLLRFRLSDEKVRELLMGRQLYGEPDLAIRELYQNALDACRYRDIRRQFLKRSKRELRDWAGLISFRQGVDTDGREYIECSDNGVGMSREMMMSTFANAGERFVYRSGFRSEQMRWQEMDPPLRLIPNSQFGVGVFSYFMIAEEIHIVTRPVDEDDILGQEASSVRIASSGSLFQITSSNEMPSGGTRIRLYLTGEDSLSVLRTLRRLLWVAEYVVQVVEDGGSCETWHPELLRFPDAVVEPLQHGTDLWWVPGEGGFAADGIRTNEERHGLIVNLRGPRRPRFTVDRNRLRQWDKAWIREQILESLSALRHWPGLTLSWLWEVADTTPSIAEDVFTYLVENEHELAVQGNWGRSTAAARHVGCLPVDRELHTGEMIPWAGGPFNWWISAWRVAAWKGITTITGMEHVAEPATLVGFPVVGPLDANILGEIYDHSQYNRRPGSFGHPSLTEVLRASADRDESPKVRIRRLRRYAITGLNLTAARAIPPIQYTFMEKDEILPENVEEEAILHAAAALAPEGMDSRVVGYSIAKASAELRVPLGEVLRRLETLTPPGWCCPLQAHLGDLRDHVFTWGEVELFTEDLYFHAMWVGATISPAHIIRVGSKLGRSTEHVLRLFDRFSSLGYEVLGRHQYPDDLTLVENEGLRFCETIGFELTWIHIVLLAGQTGKSVDEVLVELARLSESGFIRLPVGDPVAGAVTDDERTIIKSELHQFDWYSRRNLIVSDWLVVRKLISMVGAKEFHIFEERLRHRRRLLEIVDLRRPVTMPEVVDLAYYLDYGIAKTIRHFAYLYPETADLSALPEAAIDAKDVCPRRDEYAALLGFGRPNFDRYVAREVTWALHPYDIVHGAVLARQSVASFLDRLEPYRELGAPIPVINAEAREALGRRSADRYDEAMLVLIDDHGIDRPVDTVTPLGLVQTAGRLGWTLAEAHARFTLFEPIGLKWTYPAQACFDDLVHWQDLLILTEYLDGQEPSIADDVSPEHIAACADEIEETEAEVVDRLRRYAALFGFQLATEACID